MTEQDELADIAREAYVFLYPLVIMEVTRQQSTNAAAGQLVGHGPMNALVHIREFPDADFKLVVRPNFDTLYSAAFLDLTSEPVILSAPDTHGRYYMLPMLDMWTDVFAGPGPAHQWDGPGGAGPWSRQAGTGSCRPASSGSMRPRPTCGSSVAPRPTGPPTTTRSTRCRTASASARSRSGAARPHRPRPPSIPTST